jgi:hypothetical protein
MLEKEFMEVVWGIKEKPRTKAKLSNYLLHERAITRSPNNYVSQISGSHRGRICWSSICAEMDGTVERWSYPHCDAISLTRRDRCDNVSKICILRISESRLMDKQLTTCSTVLLDKLIVAQLVKKFHDFMELKSSSTPSQKHFTASYRECN